MKENDYNCVKNNLFAKWSFYFTPN